jgi:preprotein translocase subunit SecA
LDYPDVVYRTEDEKFRNAAKELKELHAKGQPVLVGTVSVQKSEKLSGLLKKMGVPHEVLNAKNHEREAFIVAQAGRKGAVTVSTNMAGRGTDILLGGNPDFITRERLRKDNKDPDAVSKEEFDAVLVQVKVQTDKEHDEVVALGGLHILGTERHESRRIDNQLRGRSGRQGDPGTARFYLSLQDDLMRIFGGQRMQNLMLRLGMEEDVPIESGLITKRIAAAQKAVEAQNFAARKHVLEYDDVMNKQRKAVYSMRRALLEGQDQKERIQEIIEGIVATFIDMRCPEKDRPETWDWYNFANDILTQFGVTVDPEALAQLDRRTAEAEVIELLRRKYDEKEQMLGTELLRETERMLMLNVIDNQWKDHLLSMDHLKEHIGMRSYAQKDPLVEYKKESWILFKDVMDRIEDETIRYLFFMQRVEHAPEPGGQVDWDAVDIPAEPDPELETAAVAAREAEAKAAQSSVMDFTRNIQRKKERELEALQFVGGETSSKANQPIIAKKTPGRNDLCSCGSGKKYKKCCGA